MRKSWVWRGAMGSTGLAMIYQVGGCALDPVGLGALFTDTFLTLLVNNFVAQFFNTGLGGF